MPRRLGAGRVTAPSALSSTAARASNIPDGVWNICQPRKEALGAVKGAEQRKTANPVYGFL